MTVMLYKGDVSKVFPDYEAAKLAMQDGWFDNPTDAKTERADKSPPMPQTKRGRPPKAKTHADQS